MSFLNIKFADGNELISYDDDTYSSSGCPTCDYGSEYVNEITIRTTNYNVNININCMYEFGFSISDAIKMFAVDLKGMTEVEFIEYIKEEFEKVNGLKRFEVTKPLRNKCPFCGAIVTRHNKIVNGFCNCGAKFYPRDGVWLNRKTGEERKDESCEQQVLSEE